VIGNAIGNAPGVTANDIPWLKLEVVNHRGVGTLADVSTVQRLDTHGGVLQGACDHVATLPAFLIPPLMSSCKREDDTLAERFDYAHYFPSHSSSWRKTRTDVRFGS
jgi:hypothetical protein